MTATLVPAIQKVRPEIDGLELRDAPKPVIRPDEVLIRVRAAAICGSDLHLYSWDESIRPKLLNASDNFRRGLTIGHEFCGWIEEVGTAVNKPGTVQYGPIAVGDFVSAESHVVCNKCYQCLRGERHVCIADKIIGFDRDGAFSQYIALPASCVWKNDPKLPFELAAVQEPLGNAMHAAAHFPLKDQAVAVFGAGPIGLFAIAIAKAHGARKIVAVDINEFRLGIAQKLGAEIVRQEKTKKHEIPLKESENQRVTRTVKEMAGNDGPDVILEMSGHPDAINNSIRAARRGGSIVLFGIPKNDAVTIEGYSTDVIFKGLSLQAIIGRHIYRTWEQVRDLLSNEENRRLIRTVITDVLPYEKFHHGFEKMLAGEAGKVVLEFNQQ